MITSASRVVAAGAQVSTSVGDEAVILELDRGAYYGVADVGRRIWALLEEPRTVGEIAAAIAAEHDVPPARCEADVVAFVTALADAGLVDVL